MRSAVLVLGSFLGLLASGLGLAACAFSKPIEEQHPSVQRAPASVDDSEEAKRDALNRTATVDLACPKVDVVLTFPIKYLNLPNLRYVVEGCGTRALYAETCEAYPMCRYLLVSTVPVNRAVQTIVVAPPPSVSIAPTPSSTPSAPPPVPSASTAAPSASTTPRHL